MDISVIIPAFNSEKTITASIKSVLDQTYPVKEVIIVDDGSDDNTEDAVKSIKDSRVSFYRQPLNMGAAAARNAGVSHAKGDIIAFHDSDDKWLPEKIEKQIKYLKSHDDCSFVYCAYVRHFSSYDLTVPDITAGICPEGDILSDLLFENSVGTCTIMMTRKLFDDIGGFDEKMRNLQDWDLALRAAKISPIGFVPEVLVDVAASSATTGITSNRERYYQSRCYMLKKYRNDYLSTNTFDKTVASILAMAIEDNMLEQVKNMLLESISSI